MRSHRGGAHVVVSLGVRMRSFGRSTIRLLCVAATAAALAAVPSAYGRLGGSVPAQVQAALDAAFAAATPALGQPGARPPPDIDDGRSRVTARWRHVFEAFAIADRDRPPAAGGVVVVGSSSISLWGNLEQQFATRHMVRRGLAGARMTDISRHADRLILPYRPSTVIVYAGDNDIAEKVQPEMVLAAYADLVRQVRRALPQARIAFISIKPSPSRAALMPAFERANELVAAFSAGDERLDYIDVYSRMLDAEGRPRADLFAADALHLNGAGYALWRSELAAHLP